jgi:hypothetical protein
MGRLYDITARRGGNGTINGTSDFQDNLAARVTRLACFMRLCRASEQKCQAHGGPELSFVSQLAEASEVLPTRPDQYSLCAFRVPENSGNRLYATQKRGSARQRRHIGSAGHKERRDNTRNTWLSR